MSRLIVERPRPIVERVLERLDSYQLSLRQAHKGTYPIRKGYVHSKEVRGERHTRLMRNARDRRRILTK